ncbi:hypothetical protein HDU98_006249 [Podochytrium sp. JEL0797]|nr:hypothetical protein HDU98_006249 [Podochytrium sp. JEL0797]
MSMIDDLPGIVADFKRKFDQLELQMSVLRPIANKMFESLASNKELAKALANFEVVQSPESLLRSYAMNNATVPNEEWRTECQEVSVISQASQNSNIMTSLESFDHKSRDKVFEAEEKETGSRGIWKTMLKNRGIVSTNTPDMHVSIDEISDYRRFSSGNMSIDSPQQSNASLDRIQMKPRSSTSRMSIVQQIFSGSKQPRNSAFGLPDENYRNDSTGSLHVPTLLRHKSVKEDPKGHRFDSPRVMVSQTADEDEATNSSSSLSGEPSCSPRADLITDASEEKPPVATSSLQPTSRGGPELPKPTDSRPSITKQPDSRASITKQPDSRHASTSVPVATTEHLNPGETRPSSVGVRENSKLSVSIAVAEAEPRESMAKSPLRERMSAFLPKPTGGERASTMSQLKRRASFIATALLEATTAPKYNMKGSVVSSLDKLEIRKEERLSIKPDVGLASQLKQTAIAIGMSGLNSLSSFSVNADFVISIALMSVLWLVPVSISYEVHLPLAYTIFITVIYMFDTLLETITIRVSHPAMTTLHGKGFIIDLITIFPFELIPVDGADYLWIVRMLRLYKLPTILNTNAQYSLFVKKASGMLGIGQTAVGNTFPLAYHPVDSGERWITFMFIIVGAGLYASIVGTISSFAMGIDASGRLYKQKLDEVREYMRWKDLGPTTRRKLLKYYELKYRGKFFEENTLLSEMNDSLRMEIATQNCRELISKVSFLRREQHDGRDELFIGRIAIALTACFFVPGDIIITQGELGNEMYFIMSGQVHVIAGGKRVAVFKEGAFFGEVALIANIPRTATVQAANSCMLYRLTRSAFSSILEEFDDVRRKVEAIYRERMEKIRMEEERRKLETATELVSKVAFLQRSEGDGRDGQFLAMIAQSLVAVFFAAGEAVFRQGEMGNEMYFVKSGTVDILVGENKVSSLTDGSFFGEVALIANIPRTATIIASTQCMLYKLTQVGFMGILQEFEDMRRRVDVIYQERMERVRKESQANVIPPQLPTVTIESVQEDDEDDEKDDE